MGQKTADPAWRHGVAFTQGSLLPQQFGLGPAPRDAKFIWARRTKRGSATKDGSEIVSLPRWVEGKVEIVPSEELYAASAHGWRERLLAYWQREWEQAAAQGYAWLLAVGEVDLPLPVPFQELVHYEQQADGLLHQLPFSALCVYDIFQVSRSQVLDLIAVHDYFSLEVLPGKVFGPVVCHQLQQAGQLADIVDFGLELARLGRLKKAVAAERARLATLSEGLTDILSRLNDELTVVAGFAELECQNRPVNQDAPIPHPLLGAARAAAAQVRELANWQQRLLVSLAQH